MKVRVRKAELFNGRKKNGEEYCGAKVLVLFPDNATAYTGFIPEDVCDPTLINPGDTFDMYRDQNGYVVLFDKVTE